MGVLNLVKKPHVCVPGCFFPLFPVNRIIRKEITAPARAFILRDESSFFMPGSPSLSTVKNEQAKFSHCQRDYVLAFDTDDLGID